MHGLCDGLSRIPCAMNPQALPVIAADAIASVRSSRGYHGAAMLLTRADAVFEWTLFPASRESASGPSRHGLVHHTCPLFGGKADMINCTCTCLLLTQSGQSGI